MIFILCIFPSTFFKFFFFYVFYVSGAILLTLISGPYA